MDKLGLVTSTWVELNTRSRCCTSPFLAPFKGLDGDSADMANEGPLAHLVWLISVSESGELPYLGNCALSLLDCGDYGPDLSATVTLLYTYRSAVLVE